GEAGEFLAAFHGKVDGDHRVDDAAILNAETGEVILILAAGEEVDLFAGLQAKFALIALAPIVTLWYLESGGEGRGSVRTSCRNGT
ncbi:MAG TPA: hypothetical protein VGM23_12480, partial [Armatimonadota bacterium]